MWPSTARPQSPSDSSSGRAAAPVPVLVPARSPAPRAGGRYSPADCRVRPAASQDGSRDRSREKRSACPWPRNRSWAGRRSAVASVSWVPAAQAVALHSPSAWASPKSSTSHLQRPCFSCHLVTRGPSPQSDTSLPSAAGAEPTGATCTAPRRGSMASPSSGSRGVMRIPRHCRRQYPISQRIPPNWPARTI